MTLPRHSPVPLGAARTLVALLTLGELLTTPPPAPSVIVRFAVLAVGLAGLALAGRWRPALERVALAVVSGALVAAIVGNLAAAAIGPMIPHVLWH